MKVQPHYSRKLGMALGLWVGLGGRSVAAPFVFTPVTTEHSVLGLSIPRAAASALGEARLELPAMEGVLTEVLATTADRTLSASLGKPGPLASYFYLVRSQTRPSDPRYCYLLPEAPELNVLDIRAQAPNAQGKVCVVTWRLTALWQPATTTVCYTLRRLP